MTASGAESETRLPFAGLHELLRPVLDRLDRLPELQRHGLEMAFGLAPREAVSDLFLIGLGTLELVAEAAAHAPLLLVVEDAQWIDPSSAAVLAFVARRLESEPVVIWFAARAGVITAFDDTSLPVLDLVGLAGRQVLGREDRCPVLRSKNVQHPAPARG